MPINDIESNDQPFKFVGMCENWLEFLCEIDNIELCMRNGVITTDEYEWLKKALRVCSYS
ncbi:MAG: hypothetical protein DRP84_10755 [Spirochaetes bacterium]|nr:MAG: hypothetical protein DRP84_10755 [Spirochaetota bacterium]